MADPISKALILVFVFIILCFFSNSHASSDVPFIIAHKKANLNRLKSGSETVSVTIDIYNQGTSTAYDISLADDSWLNDAFNVISGSTSKSWEKLDAGGVLSHTFELEVKTKGVFSSEPAVVKFRIPTKAALQEAYSSPILPLDVLADRPPEKKFDWAKRLLARYGSIISVISIMVLFVYLVASPSKSGAKGSKKKR
ncbi:PREDICTED: translocon-associated protein subunit beta-like [Lupinus angustifolius]|uniref:translocon-associated protein subunit beta-like n=1 Tax=Lupinus angustifolius TaxID=3871 RepID=UPI00092FD7F7|nr:PREDICTED: translocon-associated protein subunit beta-like [Lupinus angustifolius]